MGKLLLCMFLLLPTTCFAREVSITVDRVMTFDDQTENNIRTIMQTGRNDLVHIHIQSRGGLVAVLYAYKEALQKSGATVVTYVDIEADSAAAYLMCLGDVRVVSPLAMVMFHQAHGYDVNGAKIPANHESRSYIDSLMQNECGDLLTASETSQINNQDADIWLTGKEINERQTH